MTNIQNFKMSAYLQLSCTYNGHWLLVWVVLASLVYNLAVWLSCHLARPGDLLCEDNITLATFQIIITFTLMAYLIVISDMFTGRVKKLLAGSGLAQMRERIRKLFRSGNNSVSPLEEIDLDVSVRAGNQETAINDSQNFTILKDHIREVYFSNFKLPSLTFYPFSQP